MSDAVRILLIVLVPVFFLGLWCGICVLASRFGGWGRLADRYAVDRPFSGSSRQSFCTVGFRPCTNYGCCVTIGIEENGLWFSVLPLFRVGHPPLAIPWAETTPEPVRGGIFRSVAITFTEVPGVTMVMSRRTFEDAVGPLSE